LLITRPAFLPNVRPSITGRVFSFAVELLKESKPALKSRVRCINKEYVGEPKRQHTLSQPQ
jgi:hypothetical protein